MGVRMKKRRLFYALSLIQAIFTAQAADYSQLFDATRQHIAHFENRGENPLRCIVRATISGICGPGETKNFKTDEGFSYVGDNGKRYNKFIFNNSKNPTQSAQYTLPHPEECFLMLAPGEQKDIQLRELSHFLGLSHFQEHVDGAYRAHSKFISWHVNERGLSVLLGCDKDNYKNKLLQRFLQFRVTEQEINTYQTLNEQVLLLNGTICFPQVQDDAIKGLKIHNPSLIDFEGKTYISLRVQDFPHTPVWHARTYFGEFIDGQIKNSYQLIDDISRTHEDARLILADGKLILSYVTDCTAVGQVYQTRMDFSQPFLPGEIVTQAETITPAIKTNASSTASEKNWLLFEKNGQKILITDIDPLQLWDATGSLEKPKLLRAETKPQMIWPYGTPRSSTNPLFISEWGQWLVFFHSHLVTRDGIREYFLGALTFNNEFNIQQYTKEPLLMAHPEPKRYLGANTILPYGAVIRGDSVLLSCGINDATFCMIMLPLQSIYEKF